MISAAGIKDQDLAVIAEGCGINHPAVTRSRDLGTGPGGDGKALFGASQAVRSPEFPNPDAVNRKRQMSTRRGKSNRRRQPSGVLRAARSIRPSLAFPRPRRAAGGARRAACRAVEALLDFADQIFEIVDLAGQHERLLPLGLQRLFGFGLLLLPLSTSRAMRWRSSASAATSRGSRSFSLGDLLADPHQVGEIGGQRLGLHAHFRHHRAEHDGGAHRLQRVLGADHDGGRRVAARCAAARPAPRR